MQVKEDLMVCLLLDFHTINFTPLIKDPFPGDPLEICKPQTKQCVTKPSLYSKHPFGTINQFAQNNIDGSRTEMKKCNLSEDLKRQNIVHVAADPNIVGT